MRCFIARRRYLKMRAALGRWRRRHTAAFLAAIQHCSNLAHRVADILQSSHKTRARTLVTTAFKAWRSWTAESAEHARLWCARASVRVVVVAAVSRLLGALLQCGEG